MSHERCYTGLEDADRSFVPSFIHTHTPHTHIYIYKQKNIRDPPVLLPLSITFNH